MTMQKLSNSVPAESMVTCPDCKGHAFFDGGITLEFKETVGGSKRLKDLGRTTRVLICANTECLHPITQYDGDYVDASEYIKREQINLILDRFAGVPQHSQLSQ